MSCSQIHTVRPSEFEITCTLFEHCLFVLFCFVLFVCLFVCFVLFVCLFWFLFVCLLFVCFFGFLFVCLFVCFVCICSPSSVVNMTRDGYIFGPENCEKEAVPWWF